MQFNNYRRNGPVGGGGLKNGQWTKKQLLVKDGGDEGNITSD